KRPSKRVSRAASARYSLLLSGSMSHGSATGRPDLAIFGHGDRALASMSENGERCSGGRDTFETEDITAMTTTTYKLMNSPIGPLRLLASARGLAGVYFERTRPRRRQPGGDVENAKHPVLVEAERQLREYFSGKRRAFDLELDFVGTPFQRSVWKALL